MSDTFKGHKVEAKGLKGMDRKSWQKSFKSEEHLNKWAEKNDAEVHGSRDTDAYHYHKKSQDPTYGNQQKNIGGKS